MVGLVVGIVAAVVVGRVVGIVAAVVVGRVVGIVAGVVVVRMVVVGARVVVVVVVVAMVGGGARVVGMVGGTVGSVTVGSVILLDRGKQQTSRSPVHRRYLKHIMYIYDSIIYFKNIFRKNY